MMPGNQLATAESEFNGATDNEFASYAASLQPGLGVWINGRGCRAAGGALLDVVDPATGQAFASIADGGVADAIRAVDAAAGALPGWAALAPRNRSEILRRTFELMLDEIGPLAALMSRENGKSVADARAEVTYAAEFFRWYGEEAIRTEGAFGESPSGGTRTIVSSRPVGVAALVTPWNFPAAMLTRKIAPALAAGCTVVLKPAAETPLTALAIAKLLSRAGVPDGAVNLVPTSDASAIVGAWLDDHRVRKLSFTGSTGVGRLLLRHAADRIVNTSMELGGNAPFIVADDADLDAAVAGAMVAKFRNGGQACTAANRFYVHASAAEAFTAQLVDRVAELSGVPESAICPLITPRAVEGVHALVNAAVVGGARVAYQADPPPSGGGYFFPPTVLSGVADDDAILRTEIFGPVIAIATWTDERSLIERVNDSDYGLAAYVYSRDLRRALKIAEALEVGMVGINRGVVSDPAAPFGGMKQSGIGREGARQGMREFQEVQYFSVDWS